MMDTAYADDLLSPASDLELLQRKANIVSAFAMIFGLEISITKLRSLFMEWGTEIPAHLLPRLEIRKWGWVPCEVGLGWVIPEPGLQLPLEIEFSSITYLGIHIESNSLFERLFQETLQIIRNMCRIIGSKKASADVKASAAFLRVISMATYRGAKGPWSLEKLLEWDKPLEKLYRKIEKCMDGFPTHLLYVDSKSQGGLGYPCLSDKIQENKFAMVHRCSVTGGDSRVAADGLLLRAARIQGRPIIAEMGTVIEPILEQYWARSLLE